MGALEGLILGLQAQSKIIFKQERAAPYKLLGTIQCIASFNYQVDFLV